MKRWLTIWLSVLFLGIAAHAADLGRTLVPLDASKVATEETAFGNFVADAVRAAGGDVAIVHAMAFRANALIPTGVVDEQAIRNSLASPSRTICVLKLTPAQLRNVMQRSLGKYPNANPAFLQVSGMQVTFDGKAPAANRVSGIIVAGKALDLTDNKTTIKVAMPQELALGAVGYVLDFTDEVTKAMVKTDITLLDAVAAEFRLHKDGIEPKVEERLKDTNPPKK
ncbi:MAG: 5'-nucleotidase C-terminal domain-containing protein [Armatimonadota bacterium]